ncbi:hypothetical protein niasHT_028043 [Heterodera trifolii]|uniref:Uncharacterized protein n=1 Tax=Heterodera trifolii TaxID=157864 RepID=A0ABD2KEB7_9BILA
MEEDEQEEEEEEEEEGERGDLGEGAMGRTTNQQMFTGKGFVGTPTAAGEKSRDCESRFWNCARKRSATGAAAAAVVKFLPGGGKGGKEREFRLDPSAGRKLSPTSEVTTRETRRDYAHLVGGGQKQCAAIRGHFRCCAERAKALKGPPDNTRPIYFPQ